MSRHDRTEAIDFAARLQTAEQDRAERDSAVRALQEEVARLQSRLVELAGPKPDQETPIQRMIRQQNESIAAWEANRLKERMDALDAARRAQEAERANTMIRPQDPPLESLKAVSLAISRFVAGDSARDDFMCEHEKMRWEPFRALGEALDAAERPGEMWPGWPRATVLAVRQCRSAFTEVANRWGWRDLLGPDREERFGDMMRTWDAETSTPIDRISELWLRVAEMGEPGFCWPPIDVEVRARDARARGLNPIEIFDFEGRNYFRLPFPSGYNLLTPDHVTAVYRDNLRIRFSYPAIGKRRPTIDSDLRDFLADARAALDRSIPGDLAPHQQRLSTPSLSINGVT